MRSNKKVDLGAIECSSLNVSSFAGATGGGSITAGTITANAIHFYTRGDGFRIASEQYDSPGVAPLEAGRSLITSTQTFDTLAGYFLFICAVCYDSNCKTFLMVSPLLSDLTTPLSQDDKPFDAGAPANTPILRTAIFADRNTGAFDIVFDSQAGTDIKIISWKLFAI